MALQLTTRAWSVALTARKLAVGKAAQQAGVNELSPPTVRAIFPAFAYQLGNLFAAYIVTLETIVAVNLGSAGVPDFSLALAIFAAGAFIAVAILAAVGREAKGVDFMKVADEELAKETVLGH